MKCSSFTAGSLAVFPDPANVVGEGAGFDGVVKAEVGGDDGAVLIDRQGEIEAVVVAKVECSGKLECRRMQAGRGMDLEAELPECREDAGGVLAGEIGAPRLLP